MLDKIKAISKELILLFLGGVLASYFESLRKILENGAINVRTGIADWYYSQVAQFEPFSLTFAYLLFLMFLPVFQLTLDRLHENNFIKKSTPDNEKKAFNDKVFYTLFITIVIAILIQGFIFNSQAKINKLFDREITAISPYVPEQEIKSIKSSWVRMKTQDEYLQIKRKIDAHFKKAKIPPLQ